MSNPQKSFSESGSSPPRRITLSRIDLIPGCTVGTGVGLDADGNEVTFATDWRPALTLAGALEAGHEVEVWVDTWQVISWDSRRRS